MIRRSFLAGAALLTASPALGHSLYGQWIAYRRRNLLIGCHRKDPVTFGFAQLLVAEINHAMPTAKAAPARAPHPQRLASLLGTDQMELAVLSQADAAAINDGSGRFAAYGAVPLTLVAGMGARGLFAHADFPDRHAWMVRSALVESVLVQESEAALPQHPGAEAFLTGEPMPKA